MAVVAGLVLPVPAVALAPLATGGTITGTVTRSDGGTQMEGVFVDAYDVDSGDWIDDAVTNVSGFYTVSVPDDSSYRIEFTDDSGVYESPLYYNNAKTEAAATPVSVTGGATVANINAVMQKMALGGMKGTVTGSDGLPLESVTVQLEATDGTVEEAETDAAGNYELSNIRATDYTVFFNDQSRQYLSRYYPNAAIASAATKVTIVENTTPTVSQVLPAGPPADILVSVEKDWDDFAKILDELGWSYHNAPVEKIGTGRFALTKYKTLFVNCSMAADDMSDETAARVKAWVDAGGSVYASDWAYTLLTKSWPSAVQFYGKIGKSAIVDASVIDTGLAWYLNPSNPPATVPLDYDTGVQLVISGMGAGTRELLHGTVPTDAGDKSAPLTVTFGSGTGRVLYTTFHNSESGVEGDTETAKKLMQYFALIPYTGSLVAQIDADMLAKFPAFREVASFLSSINQGQSSVFPLSLGSKGTVVSLNWTGAKLKIQIRRPDGSLFKEQESTGGLLELEIPAGSGISAQGGIAPKAGAGWTVTVTGVEVATANKPFVMKVYANGDVQQVGGTPGSPVLLSVEGAGRIETAIKASQTAFSVADTVILATAYNFPDALGGSSLAGALNAPLLLTNKDSLPASVEAEIKRLGAKKAVILGSEAAVGKAVSTKLATLVGGAANVKRIGGADRYATAALIASETVSAIGVSNYDGKVFLATGENFPDALAASPLAAAKKRPILLTRATALPAATANALVSLKVKSAVLLGSSKVVPDIVQIAVGQPITTSRLAGQTRYQTAIEIAKAGVAEGLKWDGLALATGTNYPDALSGGVMCSRLGAVMLLTDPALLTPDVKAQLTLNKASIGTLRVLGSTSAVSAGVRNAALSALK